MKKTVLREYAKLIVQVGANVQKGQEVMIHADLDQPEFVHMVEKRQGMKISAPEEIAYRSGWITKDELLESAKLYGKSPYGQHLTRVAEDQIKNLK